MHEQGQAFGVCLANKVSKPVEGAEEVMVLGAQFCQSACSAFGRSKYLLFNLHTVPVAFRAGSTELVRNSVLLVLEQPDIQVVTRKSEFNSESGEST